MWLNSDSEYQLTAVSHLVSAYYKDIYSTMSNFTDHSYDLPYGVPFHEVTLLL